MQKNLIKEDTLMENNKKTQITKQKADRGILWAILFTLVAFIGMAILSHYFS